MGNAYLIHYGVKGQKWGVRRYKNSDGKLTSAGKAHYGKTARDSDARLTSRIKNDEDYDGYSSLMREIETKSGDWYNSKGVSPAFKKAIIDTRKAKDDIANRYRKPLREAYDASHDRLKSLTDKDYLDDGKPYDSKRYMEAYAKARVDAQYQKLEQRYSDISKKKTVAESSEYKNYSNKLASIVLNDLGYEDTVRGRKFLLDSGVLFWD